MSEAAGREAGGTLWDAANQQVVRDDASAPWEEGTGGETTEPVAEETKTRRGKKDDGDADADKADEKAEPGKADE